jgi:toxin FitB
LTAAVQDAVIVLDTNVISEPLKSVPDQRVVDFMRDVSARSFITTITLSELYFGAWCLDESRRRTQLLKNIAAVRLLYQDRTLPFTVEAAANYGRAVAQMRRSGIQIGRADAYIAATCVAHGAALATRTVKDFDGYPNLRVIEPWQS